MKTDLTEIQDFLIQLLKDHGNTFNIIHDTKEKFEVHGTIPTMQGRKKVDGIYFSTVAPKPKDVRFYFFPLYTHADQLNPILSDDLKKFLKGKTCFHMKSLSPEIEKELKGLVKKAVRLYQKDGWLE